MLPPYLSPENSRTQAGGGEGGAGGRGGRGGKVGGRGRSVNAPTNSINPANRRNPEALKIL